MNLKIVKTVLVMIFFITTTLVSKENKIFVGAAIGYTYLNIEHTDIEGSITLANNLNDNAYNYKLEGGYTLSPKLNATFNYQRIVQNEAHLDNYFLGIEYRLEKYTNFTPYVGAHLGYSRLTWDENPINTLNNDLNSGSIAGGGTLGIVYAVSEKYDINLSYTLLLMDHTTHIESGLAKSELNHHATSSFNIGFRYFFKMD